MAASINFAKRINLLSTSTPHRSQDPAPSLRAKAPQHDEAVIGSDQKDKGRQQYRRKKKRANDSFHSVPSIRPPLSVSPALSACRPSVDTSTIILVDRRKTSPPGGIFTFREGWWDIGAQG